MLAECFAVFETVVGIVRVIKRQRHLQLFEHTAPQVAIKAAAAAALALTVALVVKPGQTGREATDPRT